MSLFRIFDHPQSGIVYNFEELCLSGCMHVWVSVCQTITFKSLDVRSSYLHIRSKLVSK